MKESHLQGEARPPADARPDAPEGGPTEKRVDCLSRALGARGEPLTSLGTAVNDVCAGLALRDTFRALFSDELLGARVSWPRIVGAGHARASLARPREHVGHWLHQGDVLVELARSLPREPFALGIALSAAGAVQLTDRLLGAPTSSALASRAGAPSDAECGVLAYAAARLTAAHGGGWLVRDVRASTLVGADELVLWPATIDTATGRLELTVWMSGAVASVLPAVELQVVLHESFGEDDALALAAGQVWVSDQLPLTHTSLGLTGPVTLRVPGCEHLIAGRLSEHYVECTPERAPPSPGPHDVELLVSSRELDFASLAALSSGARCFLGEVGREHVSVRRGGQTIARGELVVWRGALGVRITEA